MPLVRIDIGPGHPAGFGRAVGDIVYRAMTTEINVPADDKFQIITAHEATELNIPVSYLGIAYSPGIVFIQVTLNAGRTTELKKKFYRRIADAGFPVATDNKEKLHVDHTANGNLH